MRALRILFVLSAALLAGLIVRAFVAQASFFGSFATIMADPWGLVALVDLYLGFLVAAAVIGLAERTRTAALWVVAIFLLGNVVTALWAAWRLPQLARRLAG